MKVASFLLAFAILAAPAGWYLAQYLFWTNQDFASREEFVEMQDQVKALTINFNNMQQQVEILQSRGASDDNTTYTDRVEAFDTLMDSFSQVALIADRRNVNAGLTNSSSSYLVGLFGLPRAEMTADCAPMTNPILKDLVQTVDVGPIRVTLLEPAIISLRQVFRNVQIFEPELYERISTAGSLCVRWIRGSTTSVSTHSFGLSVDLNIDGQLDVLGDDRTQLGLILLADFFKKEGWYWGAGFSREDSMHFQVSREKIEAWRRLGQIPDGLN